MAIYRMSDVVHTERLPGMVAVVTLNRPDVANAIDPAVATQLGAIVEHLEHDDTVRAIVLTGAGKRAFCAGADLNAIADGRRSELYTDKGGFAGFNETVRAKLWIAAVDAPALAGGLEIALACDIIVASTDARFGLPEVSRGLVAAAGGLYRLPRRIGSGAAIEMIATGQSVDAKQALALGLADHVVEAGGARARAVAIATLVAANAPVAVRESVAVARRALDTDGDALRELSLAAALRNSATQDFHEGPRAFLEKRAPRWSGR